ncbi:MAG: DMT family transporter [Candidatus Mcinerneyibacterium aminivorans]|uniref:DMT family transporter n=1 Tax=Candidatus Mcinerneyibacterium aminivorans TaxID=2703815 RepID=A0A5D0MKF5_9BACT|nr:MAG: DMT family transporter [Candidatus Mcinerneyibacterium aminivorans]
MKDNKPKAIFFMILSSLFFALMGVMVKSTREIPVFQQVFVRNLVVVIFIFAGNKMYYKANLLGKKENRKYLVLRSIFGVIGLTTFFYAMSKLYLADATMLNKLSPFFVTLFAGMFLNEKIKKIQIPILIVAFTGALLIIKPKFDLTILPALIGFISGITSGAAYTVVRYLKEKEHTFVIIFYFSVIALVSTSPFLLINFKTPSYKQAVLLILIGVFATGGQIFLTLAYKHCEASRVAIYMYSHIIFALIFGIIFWNEIPDILSITGGVLIIAGAIANYYVKREKKKEII